MSAGGGDYTARPDVGPDRRLQPALILLLPLAKSLR